MSPPHLIKEIILVDDFSEDRKESLISNLTREGWDKGMEVNSKMVCELGSIFGNHRAPLSPNPGFLLQPRY